MGQRCALGATTAFVSCARASSSGRRVTPPIPTKADAAAYARRIHAEVYRTAPEDVLAIPVLTGLKTDAERFAGATATLTCEGMMRDGKALQLATSHELGQNFARAFDITYTDEHGTAQHCWTTSWGSTTRMIGGLIMVHGDDAGLRLPPGSLPSRWFLWPSRMRPGSPRCSSDLSGISAAPGSGSASIGARTLALVGD